MKLKLWGRVDIRYGYYEKIILIMEERQNSYRDNPWIDPRCELRPSPIHGIGIFTTRPIAEGEIITVWGGTVFTTTDIKAGKARENCFAEIGEDVYIGTCSFEPPSVDDFMNHSCDPNTWLDDEVTISARRLITAGEEITIDYAIFSVTMSEDYSHPSFECRCGSPLCRGEVTSDDWKLPKLQQRYRGHFSPYINERIRNLT